MNKKQLKSAFADVLLPLGYAGVKDMFFLHIGDVFLIVDLEKSSFGGSYTFAGVTLELREIIRRRTESDLST